MVRAWNVPFCMLKRQRLLGQHLESHVMFNAVKKLLEGEKAGWQNHPQTRRFHDNIGQLVDIHEKCVEEFKVRGYNHKSPLDITDIEREEFQYTWDEFIQDLWTLEERQGKP